MDIPEANIKKEGANINLGEKIPFYGLQSPKYLNPLGLTMRPERTEPCLSSTAQQLAVWDASERGSRGGTTTSNPSPISFKAAALEIVQLSRPHSPLT